MPLEDPVFGGDDFFKTSQGTQWSGLSGLCPNPVNFQECPTLEVTVAPQATFLKNLSTAILSHVQMLWSFVS